MQDESEVIAVMMATYQRPFEDFDEMTGALFRGLFQHIPTVEEMRAYYAAKATAQMLGIKLTGG